MKVNLQIIGKCDLSIATLATIGALPPRLYVARAFFDVHIPEAEVDPSPRRSAVGGACRGRERVLKG